MTPGELLLDISIEDDTWREHINDVDALAERAAQAAWRASAPDDDITAEASIVLLNDARQQVLNRDYRGQDKSTNVLSFAAGDDGPRGDGAPRLLGDITVALETVEREAQSQEKTLANHFSHLVVHGMLHLVGHDHEGDADAAAMEGLETEILSTLGIPDPYADRTN